MVQVGAGDDSVQGAFKLSDVARDVLRYEHDDLFRNVAVSLHLDLFLKYRDARLKVRRLYVGDEAPLEA